MEEEEVRGGGSSKGEELTEHTPQDVPSNTALVRELTVYAYQEVMKPCSTNKSGAVFAMISQGDALNFPIRGNENKDCAV